MTDVYNPLWPYGIMPGAIVRKQAAMDSFSTHILVVAATPALRFTLEELLRHYGYTVTAATRGEAADLVAHGAFDVVVLDEALPAITKTGSTPLIQTQPQTVLRHALEAEWTPSSHSTR